MLGQHLWETLSYGQCGLALSFWWRDSPVHNPYPGSQISCRVPSSVLFIAASEDSLLVALFGRMDSFHLLGRRAFLATGLLRARSITLCISLMAPESAAACWARGRTFVAEHRRLAEKVTKIRCRRYNIL